MMCLIFPFAVWGGGRGGGVSGFWVAWVFSSFHFYLFMVEDFVENHMCFYIVFARERQKELEEG
jgi:hypothetical protein